MTGANPASLLLMPLGVSRRGRSPRPPTSLDEKSSLCFSGTLLILKALAAS